MRFQRTESSACVVSGFTIQGGTQYSYGNDCGGGLQGAGCQATIEYCVIQNNIVYQSSPTGGAGGIPDCDGTIRSCTIRWNYSEYGGRGLNGCDGLIEGNTIEDNGSAFGTGGLKSCNGTIRGNVVQSHYCGGLAYCNATIEGNTIDGNTATYGGAFFNCSATIRDNFIRNNYAYEGAVL